MRQKTRNLKSFFFSKHTVFRRSWLDTWTWADIRLIASHQHTPRVTAFSWSNAGRRLPWESLFRNLIWNYSLSMIESKKKLYVYTFVEKVMRSVWTLRNNKLLKIHVITMKYKAQFCKEIHFLWSDLLFQCNMNQRLKHIFCCGRWYSGTEF